MENLPSVGLEWKPCKTSSRFSTDSNCNIFTNLEVMKEIWDPGSKKQCTDAVLEFLTLETLTLAVARAEEYL